MEKSFSYNHSNIFYRVEGEGKPVVLLHGFGEDSHIWDRQIDFLKQHCLLIVPDLPGSGKSDLLEKAKGKRQKLTLERGGEPADDSVSIDDYADCIYALLQHENILHCTMLGHSMGGYITLAFADKYPLWLTGFGLVHSTAFADNEEKKRNRERSIELIESYGGHAFLKTTIPNLFAEQFKEEHPEQVAALIKASKNFTKKALQQYTLAMMRRPDRTSVLKSNPLPVLFVIGTEDIAAPMADLMQQTPLPLISYIHVLHHTGHMGMWEATGQMNDIMLDFINRP